MITLIQFPWSPFCVSIRRIMECHRIPHRIKNVAASDRAPIILATKGRAYSVPCLIDGKTVVADFTDFGQEVARYVDRKHKLGLFPRDKEGTTLTRFKERKFGKGCVTQWARDRSKLNRQFADLLKPIDNMLAESEYLVTERPLFVDYDLYGIVENYLYSGKTKLPPLKQLRRWHNAMSRR